MYKVSSLRSPVILSLFGSIILLLGALYSGTTKAETASPQPPGTQLAWFVGYHDYYGGGYYRPNYVHPGPRYKYKYRTVRRNGRYYAGYTCKKTCQVDIWDGRLLGCRNRCY